MEESVLDTDRSFEQTLAEDAQAVARRTLRGKFGRLSNLRILGVLRAAAERDPDFREMSDDELLHRWFVAFESSFQRLRSK